MRNTLHFLFLAVVLVAPCASEAASFDCKKASRDVERNICSDSALSKLDDDLASSYRAATKLTNNKSELLKRQATWLKESRNKCVDNACLVATYSARIEVLDSLEGMDIYEGANKLSDSYDSKLLKELLDRRVNRGDERALYASAMVLHSKNEKAIPVLQVAAKNGDMDALYVLASDFNIDREKNTIFAAEHGSARAIQGIIDQNYFHNDKFIPTRQPQLAYQYYLIGKKANPSLSIYREERVIEELRMCAEAGPLSVGDFLKEYGLTVEDSPWKQARLISEKEHAPQLILQLVCLGGDVPFEKEMAVKEAYRAWKNNRRFVFGGCSYAQSKYSMGACFGTEGEGIY